MPRVSEKEMAAILDKQGTIIGRDEMERFTEAMKDVRFRELLHQYAEEISDPKTLRRYEEELCLLEKERGYDATFVYPEGGYVLKTTASSTSDDVRQVAFINICKNNHVDAPSCSRSEKNDIKGLNWTVPYLLSPPREDADGHDEKCSVYDVIFNPDTLYMASKNIQFCKMIEETALDGVEERFSVKLNRENISYPKIAFKGQALPTIIRKPGAPASSAFDADMETFLGNKLNQMRLSEKLSTYLLPNNNNSELDNASDSPVTPEYSIKYRQAVRLDDYDIISIKSANIRPTEIVIDVHLPKVDCAGQLNLDVSNQTLTLTSVAPNPAYLLKVGLAFPINYQNGNAQFDKTTRHLIVTLPVIPYKVPQLAECHSFNENEDIHCCNFDSSKCPDMKDEDRYPLFHFNQSSDSVALVVDVPNIDPSSIELDCCACGKSSKLEFCSSGSDDMPQRSYILCLRFDNSVDPNGSCFDVSDQNLVAKFTKASPGVWNSFSSSTCGRDWIENSFLTRETMLGRLENLQKETDRSLERSRPLENIDVNVRNVSEENVTIEVQVPDKSHLLKEKATGTLSSSLSSQDGSEFSKPRNDSESSEESSRQYKRGILKYSHSWRSISESSDDFSANQDFLSSDAEWSSESLASKKMVRFSDNISRNIFRPNSSILGQKRKNQKRSQHKKKRNSGSESEPSEEVGDSAEGCSSMSESEPGIDESIAEKTRTELSPISERTSPAEIPKKDGVCTDMPHKALDFRTSETVTNRDTTDIEICKTGFDQISAHSRAAENENDEIPLDFRTSEVVNPCDRYKKDASSIDPTKKSSNKLLDFRALKENEEMLDFRTIRGDGSKKFNPGNKNGGKFRTSKHHWRRYNSGETPAASDFRTDNPRNADGVDFRTSKRASKENDFEKSPSLGKSDVSKAELALEAVGASKNVRKKKKGRRMFAEALENGQETSSFANEDGDVNGGWMQIKTKYKRKWKRTHLNQDVAASEINYDADEQSPSPDSETKQKEFKMKSSTRKHKVKEVGDLIESTTALPISKDPECFHPSCEDEGLELDFSNVMFELD